MANMDFVARTFRTALAGVIIGVGLWGCGGSSPPVEAPSGDPAPPPATPDVPELGKTCEPPSLLTAVPNPSITGPIPLGADPGDASHDYPFFYSDRGLAQLGYVEEEFFIEGPEAAYRTRIVIRRPENAANYNCTLLVEWYNVTNGYDVEIDWIYAHQHIMRAGYAWMGISAQSTGIDGLIEWSPMRYGTLVANDSLSFDIFAQAIMAARNPVGTDPMAGLGVDKVIAIGASQSAIFYHAYYNGSHSAHRVVDGYLMHVWGSIALNTETVGTKVLKIISETEVPELSRQADSSNYRVWEVAGSSHQDYTSDIWRLPLMQRDLGPEASLNNTCDLPPRSRIPAWYVMHAGLDHLSAWIDGGPAPPIAPPMDIANNEIARDEFGNALGGIRLPQHAVATATNTGYNSCARQGSHEPFDAATLQMLYPTREGYLEQVELAIQAAVADGFLLPEDADATRSEAQQANLGR